MKTTFRSFVALLLLALPALLSGCAEDDIRRSVDDPKYLPMAYASVSAGICFILVLFAGWGVWRALLNTVRFVGVLSVAVAPLYWAATQNLAACIVMAASGLASAGLVTLVFRDDFKRWSGASEGD